MKTAKFNEKGTRQLVNSGWKTFDGQTNYLGTGNVWASTQYSSYIRAYSDVKNGAHIGKPGDFLKYDLHAFQTQMIPDSMMDLMKNTERKDSYILYEFFTLTKDGRREVFGHILTDKDYKLLSKQVYCPYINPSSNVSVLLTNAKSTSALDNSSARKGFSEVVFLR